VANRTDFLVPSFSFSYLSSVSPSPGLCWKVRGKGLIFTPVTWRMVWSWLRSAFFQSFSPLFLAFTHSLCRGPLRMTLAPTSLLTDLPRLLPGTPRADGKEVSRGPDHAGSDGRRRVAPASHPLQVTSAARPGPIAARADFSAGPATS